MRLERRSTLIALALALCSSASVAQESGRETAPRPASTAPDLDRVVRPSGAGEVAVRSYVLQQKATAEPVAAGAASRIFGGRDSEEGAWPALVSLHAAEKLDGTEEELFQSQFCGGTIIARQWVLTAAHCVVGEDGSPTAPEAVKVRTGAVDLSAGDVRDVARVIVHEDYDPASIDSDIALLQLAVPITETSGPVGAIPVLESGAEVPLSSAVVAGWGILPDGKFPRTLKEADIDIVPNDICNRGMAEQTRTELGSFLLSVGRVNSIPMESLEEAFEILASNIGDRLTANMICAGTPSGERTACNGDSGGPLMVQRDDGMWVQVGIVSWGREPFAATSRCAHKDLYSVYTRASNYFDWIARHVRG